MIDPAREYWLHNRTGDMWAVELEGVDLVRCCGPVTRAEATAELLPHLTYGTADLAWLHDHDAEFSRPDLDGNYPGDGRHDWLHGHGESGSA